MTRPVVNRSRSRGHAFRRGVAGYRRSDVDRFIAEVEVARSSLERELERLRAVESLTRVGDDVAALVTSFATAASSLRDQIASDVERKRVEAEEYATTRMAEADRTLEQARRHASAVAQEMISRAHEEISVLAEQQLTIADALDRAAASIAVSREAIAQAWEDARKSAAIAGYPRRSPDRAPPTPPTLTTVSDAVTTAGHGLHSAIGRPREASG